MNNYKLHVKIGDHVFESEGPEESVKEAFAIWKEIIGSMPINSPSTGRELSPPKQNGNTPANPGSIDIERLNRLFAYDQNKDLVSVKIFPRGDERDRDTLLLILFGYKAMKDQHEVQVTQLVPALRQSGCRVLRIDKLAAKYVRSGLINKGGMAKGGRYSLTNSGINRAMEIFDELVT